MSGLIAWACRTPRRLIAVLAAPIAVLVVIGSIWSGQHRGDDAGSTRSGQVAAANAQVPDATPFVTAAVNFVNVWGKLAPGQSADQWHSAVRALATPDLSAKLDQTDPNGLVGASATGRPEVRFVSSTSSLVAVPMANGRTVVVTVVRGEGSNWLVDDVQPDVGN